MSDEGRRRWYACPACLEVVPGLVELLYARGLEELGPAWRCDACVRELLELERAAATVDGGDPGRPRFTAAGAAARMREAVWGVELTGEVKGAPVAVVLLSGPKRRDGEIPRSLTTALEALQDALGGRGPKNGPVGRPRTPATGRPRVPIPGRGR